MDEVEKFLSKIPDGATRTMLAEIATEVKRDSFESRRASAESLGCRMRQGDRLITARAALGRTRFGEFARGLGMSKQWWNRSMYLAKNRAVVETLQKEAEAEDKPISYSVDSMYAAVKRHEKAQNPGQKPAPARKSWAEQRRELLGECEGLHAEKASLEARVRELEGEAEWLKAELGAARERIPGIDSKKPSNGEQAGSHNTKPHPPAKPESDHSEATPE